MNKKVLLVDDEPDIIAILKYNLEKEGFDVRTATNGKEGIAVAKTTSGLRIDRNQYAVFSGDNEITLPKKEFELLALLMSKPGNIFTREIILDTVWGSDIVVGDRTIDVHIRKLREKIGDHYIKTVKGVGYKVVI